MRQRHLSGAKNEHVVVARLMPALRQVFRPSGRTVTNGEYVEWPSLPSVSPRKPDVNIGLSVFMERKTMGKSEDDAVQEARDDDDELVCGIPVTASVSGDSFHLGECKTHIGTPSQDSGNAGLGELEDYDKARIMALNMDNGKRRCDQVPVIPLPLNIRSMLAGREYFWLLTMDTATGSYARLDYGKWTDLGSADAIRNHFPLLPWECAVLRVFDGLAGHNIQPYQPFADEDGEARCFLGQGGMGRVFRAWHKQKHVAVKVVLPCHAGLLETEYRLISKLDPKLPVVQACSELIYGDFGAGYAMSPVGVRSLHDIDLLKKFLRTTYLQEALLVLFRLHDGGFVHGDARLANLILCTSDKKQSLLWIDLAELQENPGPLAFKADVLTFAKACVPQMAVWPDEFVCLIKAYAERPSEATLQPIGAILRSFVQRYTGEQ
jgi:hypothetical protein